MVHPQGAACGPEEQLLLQPCAVPTAAQVVILIAEGKEGSYRGGYWTQAPSSVPGNTGFRLNQHLLQFLHTETGPYGSQSSDTGPSQGSSGNCFLSILHRMPLDFKPENLSVSRLPLAAPPLWAHWMRSWSCRCSTLHGIQLFSLISSLPSLVM